MGTSGLGILGTIVRGVRGSFNGKSVVHVGSRRIDSMPIVPANSVALSVTLKINKCPGNHIIRVCNPRSSNGAALTVRTVTRTRGTNNVTTFVSTRRTFSDFCTRGLNISISGLLVSRPSGNRRTLRVTSSLVHSDTVSVVIVSSITTLAPGTRVRNRVNSSGVNLRTHLVSRTLHGLASDVSGAGAIYVFVGRLHSGVNIICNGPRAAANNGTLGFCTDIHVSVHHVSIVGSNRRRLKAHAGIGIIGGGITPPFGHTRFSVVFNRNVSGVNRVISLNISCNIIGGTKS